MKFHFADGFDRALSVSLRTVLLIASFLLATGAMAQTSVIDEVEIDRDADELADLLVGIDVAEPDSAPLLETAMIITNIGDGGSLARCHANNRNGITVGRIRVRIPAGGVRFFLVSDLVSQPRGFVGSVICRVPGPAVGTEILLGLITTDVDVHHDYDDEDKATSILFPVTAMR